MAYSLKAICGLNISLEEVKHPKSKDTRTGEEIVEDVITSIGLKPKGE